MPEVYNGYMSQAGKLAKCDKCGEPGDASGMIAATKASDNSQRLLHLGCYFAVMNAGAAGAAQVREIPRAVHPRACLAASAHATLGAALERADVVAYHLGTRPEILPREHGAPEYFVIGDSPLVKGFKPAANPLA